MDLDIILLSFIQGISEILPISSSVNLHFFSHIFNINTFSFSLKIALHAGSIIALIIFFRKEIIDIFKGLLTSKPIMSTHLIPLFFGTIPVVIIGYFARDYVKEFDSPRIMGILSIIFGIILFIIDKLSCNKSRTDKNPISITKAFIIGCFQTIAIFPGVSRLGICITASRMLGLDRKKSIYFSLLLAIPSILGSLTLELFECYLKKNFHIFSSNSSLIGIISTAIISLIAIWPCVKYMENHGFGGLALYRIIIGIITCFAFC